MVEQDITLLENFEKITRALFRKIQCLYLLRQLRPFRLEVLVIDDLQQPGKIYQAGLRDIENIVVIKVPLDLQNPHHPRIRLFHHLQPHDPARPSRFYLALEIFKKVGFDVFTFFQCEVPIPVDTKEIDTCNLNVAEQVMDIIADDVLNRNKKGLVLRNDLIESRQVIRNLNKTNLELFWLSPGFLVTTPNRSLLFINTGKV